MADLTRRSLLHGIPTLGMSPLVGISSEVHNAIVRHDHANRLFSANCWRSDELDPRYAADTPQNNERIFWSTLNAEADALEVLLATPVHTHQCSTAKGKHLLTYLHCDGLDPRHFEPLLQSMIF